MTRQRMDVWQKLLIGYWLVLTIIFFLYLFLTASRMNVQFSDVLVQLPGFAISFLLSCLMWIQGIVFIRTKMEMRGKFLFFAIIQQALTLNFIGAIFSYFALRKQSTEYQFDSKTEKMSFYCFWVLILFLSLFVTFLMWRMTQI